MARHTPADARRLPEAAVGARELAQYRSHWDAEVRRLREGILKFGGAASGLTGKARIDKCLAAGMWIGGFRRCLRDQRERQRHRGYCCKLSHRISLRRWALWLTLGPRVRGGNRDSPSPGRGWPGTFSAGPAGESNALM